MAKPIIHAESSARKFGGEPSAYLPVHDFLDSSKGSLPDNRHRALTHQSWFLSTVLERALGHEVLIPAKPDHRAILELHLAKVRNLKIQIEIEQRELVRQGYIKAVSTREVGEQHIKEDLRGYIPTAQDFLQDMEFKNWMAGLGHPPSFSRIAATKKTTATKTTDKD
jgi:hypothetical protein